MTLEKYYNHNIMKTYIGTKTVKAEPMTVAEAEKVLGRKIDMSGTTHPDEEEGYLVEYEDGYKSFSPKEVFEKAYKCSEDFIDRLHIERDELAERLGKLRNFTQTAWFDSFPKKSRDLMKKQEELMSGYLTVLTARIELAEE